MPSDAVNHPCVLRSRSAVPDRGASGRHDLAQNGIRIRMVRDTTAQTGTWRYPTIELLIRRSQVRILPGAPQNPSSDGVSEDLGRGPRGVFGSCVLLVCSPVQGQYRWVSISRSTSPSRDRAGPPSMCPRTPFNTPRPPLNPYPARGATGDRTSPLRRPSECPTQPGRFTSCRVHAVVLGPTSSSTTHPSGPVYPATHDPRRREERVLKLRKPLRVLVEILGAVRAFLGKPRAAPVRAG